MSAGGTVTNQISGSITGARYGVDITGSPGTVTNLGTISSTGAAFGDFGIKLAAGGSVTNGASGSTTALITGYGGIGGFGTSGTAATTVTNFIKISGTDIVIELGFGTVINSGSASEIVGGFFGGLEIYNFGASVSNSGTIKGTGTNSVGVFFDAYGSVTNGAIGNTAALITGGFEGIEIDNLAGTQVNLATVNNYGTIGTVTGGQGIFLGTGRVTNGASSSTAAVITGTYGIVFYGTAATLVNFGTVAGSG